jgi:chlorobactene glucosyltransferase
LHSFNLLSVICDQIVNIFLLITAAFLFFLWSYYLYKIVITLKQFPIPRNIDRGSCPPLPFISVLIPARNEEKNIRKCIESLLRQNYPNYEIIAVNDRSTDNTLTILRELEELHPRLRVVNIEKSHKDWSGKNYALHLGVDQARGDWFLFSDADTEHYPISLLLGIQEAFRRETGFLTFLTQMNCKTFSEKLIQPIASGLMTLWYPIEKLNNPHDPLGFANGQYILMDRNTYQMIGGHLVVKDRLLEDVALSEEAKQKGITFWISIGTYALKTRMYHGFINSWNGWKRIFIHLTEKCPFKLLKSAIGLFVLGLLPILIVILGFIFDAPFLTLWFVSGVFVYSIIVRWIFNILGRQPQLPALLYPIGTLITLGILINAIWDSLLGNKTNWRGVRY